MGAKSVGRPRKNTHRVELRLNADDPMVKALEREAAARHVTLQQYITDILIARYMSVPIPQEPLAELPDMASALSNEWM